jgi:hypothetical protein
VIRILTLVRFLPVAQRQEFFQGLKGRARFVRIVRRLHQRSAGKFADSQVESLRERAVKSTLKGIR